MLLWSKENDSASTSKDEMHQKKIMHQLGLKLDKLNSTTKEKRPELVNCSIPPRQR